MSMLAEVTQVEALQARIATREAQVRDLHAALAAERAGRQADKAAYELRIASLRQMLYGKTSEKRRGKSQAPEPQTPPPAPVDAPPATFLGAAVDAGATQEEAEEQHTKRIGETKKIDDAERLRRKKAKNAKKGLGSDQAKKPVNGGGRREVNPRLEPIEEIVVVPAEERVLPNGRALVFKCYETSMKEFHLPAKVVRLVIKREVLADPDTGDKVVTAPIPPAIVPRSKYHDSMIVESMVRKFWTGTPFGRIIQDVQALGSDLNDAVLSDALFRVARFLSSVVLAIRAQVLAERDVCMDETPLPTQDGNHYLWAILAGGQVFFYSGRRSSDTLRTILGLPPKTTPSREQGAPPTVCTVKIVYCMTDAFTGYDKPLQEAGIIRQLCWAHGRRNFRPFEDDDPAMAGVIVEIGALYGIEKQAKREVDGLQLVGAAATAVYGRLRAELSKPQLAKLQVLLGDLRPRYAEGSAQRNAIDYLLTRWECFTRYAERGDLPIDNNDCERVLRPVVTGRKNWMLIGSEDAAQPAADLYTVMESCRLCHVDPRRYLAFVVQALHAGRKDVANLTPRSLATMFAIRN